jgi:ATP-dependent Zn protease
MNRRFNARIEVGLPDVKAIHQLLLQLLFNEPHSLSQKDVSLLAERFAGMILIAIYYIFTIIF